MPYCLGTARLPFLGKLVSSMIHASTGPWRSSCGSTSSRTFARMSHETPPCGSRRTALAESENQPCAKLIAAKRLAIKGFLRRLSLPASTLTSLDVAWWLLPCRGQQRATLHRAAAKDQGYEIDLGEYRPKKR